MLTVSAMLRLMRQRTGAGRPKPFSIVFVTANRPRKTGGEIRFMPDLTLVSIDDRQVLLQPHRTKEILRVSIDLILLFNNQPLS